MTGPRVPMLQRKPGAGAGGPPAAGGKMPPLPLPSAGVDGDPEAQAALMQLDQTNPEGAPDVPSGTGMTQCPNCGCAFDPVDPAGTAVPPSGGEGGGAPGAGGGGGPPSALAAKLAGMLGGGAGGGGGAPPPG